MSLNWGYAGSTLSLQLGNGAGKTGKLDLLLVHLLLGLLAILRYHDLDLVALLLDGLAHHMHNVLHEGGNNRWDHIFD